MLTNADKITADIAAQKALIEANDKQIAEAEERQRLRRQHGERLYNRLCRLEEQLKREDAPMVKQTGKCVIEKAPNGVEWRV